MSEAQENAACDAEKKRVAGLDSEIARLRSERDRLGTVALAYQLERDELKMFISLVRDWAKAEDLWPDKYDTATDFEKMLWSRMTEIVKLYEL